MGLGGCSGARLLEPTPWYTELERGTIITSVSHAGVSDICWSHFGVAILHTFRVAWRGLLEQNAQPSASTRARRDVDADPGEQAECKACDGPLARELRRQKRCFCERGYRLVFMDGQG